MSSSGLPSRGADVLRSLFATFVWISYVACSSAGLGLLSSPLTLGCHLGDLCREGPSDCLARVSCAIDSFQWCGYASCSARLQTSGATFSEASHSACPFHRYRQRQHEEFAVGTNLAAMEQASVLSRSFRTTSQSVAEGPIVYGILALSAWAFWQCCATSSCANTHPLALEV